MSAATPPPAPGPGGMRRSGRLRLAFGASLAALLGLGVTIAHFIWPTPLLFALFMTVGQGSFAVGILLYLILILADLRGRRVL